MFCGPNHSFQPHHSHQSQECHVPISWVIKLFDFWLWCRWLPVLQVIIQDHTQSEGQQNISVEHLQSIFTDSITDPYTWLLKGLHTTLFSSTKNILSLKLSPPTFPHTSSSPPWLHWQLLSKYLGKLRPPPISPKPQVTFQHVKDQY